MRGAKIAKTSISRRLRRNATIAEQRLWYRVRSRSLCGVKFVRQEPIGPYIVDFVCREHRLIIEVDGGQHAESKRDFIRDQWLRDHGYQVLRFWNNDVIENTDDILEAIAEVMHSPPFPRLPGARSSPSPRLRGEGWGGAFPPAQTGHEVPPGAPERSDPWSRPEQALSPLAGRGEGRSES